jgi:hypothetical protein
METPEPQKQHEWLTSLAGDWTFETECAMKPGDPPMKSKGTETVRAIGGLWIQAEGHGTIPGGAEATTIMTLGYDTRIERFTGTFIGSMMTHLWPYNGALDASGKALTLDSEGPGITDQTVLAPYRDVIEIVSADHRTLTSYTPDANGQWQLFMTAHYYRAK